MKQTEIILRIFTLLVLLVCAMQLGKINGKLNFPRSGDLGKTTNGIEIKELLDSAPVVNVENFSFPREMDVNVKNTVPVEFQTTPRVNVEDSVPLRVRIER